MAESRLRRLEDGRYQYAPKKGVTFTLTPRPWYAALVALVPPPRRHFTSFHASTHPTPRSYIVTVGLWIAAGALND